MTYGMCSGVTHLVNHFTRKNGNEESHATAICKVDQAKELGKILQSV